MNFKNGAMGIRTPDLLNAIEALYQLSYDPFFPVWIPFNMPEGRRAGNRKRMKSERAVLKPKRILA